MDGTTLATGHGPWHSAMLIILGGLVTTLGGTILSYYITDRQRENQARIEKAAARLRNGADLERRLLAKTGSIFGALRQVKDATRTGVVADADKRMAEVLSPAWLEWRNGLLALRNETGRVFDIESSNLIYQPSNKGIFIDKCGVVASFDDPAASKDCAPRRAKERTGLNHAVEAGNNGLSILDAGKEIRIPTDFDTSVSIAKQLLQRTIDCQRGLPVENAPQSAVENCNWLKNNASMRVNMVGLVQEAVAARLLEVWTQNDAAPASAG